MKLFACSPTHGCCHFGEKRHTKNCHMAAREAAAIFTLSKPRCCSVAQELTILNHHYAIATWGIEKGNPASGFPRKAPAGLPARSELWAAAMPQETPGHRHCPAVLPGKPGDWDQVCLSLTLLPPEGTAGQGQAGERTGQLSTVCSHSCPGSAHSQRDGKGSWLLLDSTSDP